MKAIIWDLDGTLIDSYKAISTGVKLALEDFGIYKDLDSISNYVQTYSVTSYSEKIVKEYNIDYDLLFQKYLYYNDQQNNIILPLPNAKETLNQLYNNGILHFIYTHKSNISHEILKLLDMHQYFTKILTIDDGFKRKPDPEAINYLINTYSLDKNETYYVGDRSLDIESALNAGIKSIFYKPDCNPGLPTGKEDYVVHDLLEIIDLI